MEREQQELFFSLPLNFTARVGLRRIRRKKFPAEKVGMWYAMFHDLGKQSRVFGEFSTDVEAFVSGYGGIVPEPDSSDYDLWFTAQVELWQAFEAEGFVLIDGDPTDISDTFRVTVLDMRETNVPRKGVKEPMTDAERQAKRRAKLKAAKRHEQFSSDGVFVTSSHESHDESRVTLRKERKGRDTNDGNDIDARVRAREADDKQAWVDQAVDLLDSIHGGVQSKRRAIHDDIVFHHYRSGEPGDAYIRAARTFAKKIKAGGRPRADSTPMGWYLSMIRSHREELTLSDPASALSEYVRPVQ